MARECEHGVLDRYCGRRAEFRAVVGARRRRAAEIGGGPSLGHGGETLVPLAALALTSFTSLSARHVCGCCAEARRAATHWLLGNRCRVAGE
jgi:hypothetical protein